ncbi:MAG: 6-phosphogluconate dehydrogenase, decarboxylating [Armatimonadota bacterium]|nr:MAG: 6-phosphogluconate dehydrogenase, decarboxylating [Armatimonadota bacterium]
MAEGNFIGLIGLGVMGQNLALNIARKGYSVSVYNRTAARTEAFVKDRVHGEPITPAYDLQTFVQSLARPRKIILMVQAGAAVDAMIETLVPLLESGDLVIDMGNSHYADTERRMESLATRGLLFLGTGVSGGERGALEGPSIMPGGTPEAYALVEEVLVRIAAQTEDGACCTYLGRGGAGHFVKMVHNGIEYAIMQAIAEAYDVLRSAARLSTSQIADLFEQWNQGELNSFLMEISYKALRKSDEETGKPLVEMILDKAEQKGTGKWTAQAALDLGVPTPSLATAVFARTLSHFKEDRVKIAEAISDALCHSCPLDTQLLTEAIEHSLRLSMFLAFSQGLWLLSEASRAYDYGLNLSEVLRIWKGGCIIRARMLNFLREIVQEGGDNPHLLLSPKAQAFVLENMPFALKVMDAAHTCGIPVPVLSSAVDYLLSMSRANLPANLIQAQRDFFGAHTYERVDKAGTFHTEWE